MVLLFPRKIPKVGLTKVLECRIWSQTTGFKIQPTIYQLVILDQLPATLTRLLSWYLPPWTIVGNK